jgi:acyl carrier protein
MSLQGDLGADALDLIGLSLRIEDAFGITCEDAEFDRCGTVGDFVRLVESRTGRRAA